MDDQTPSADRKRDGQHELSSFGGANPDESTNHPERSEGMTDSGRQPNVHPTNNDPDTVSIPCHHIRLGDFLILQGRPCQVIRISTSSATGQYRYLGVDLFTKELLEESSFISNPAPSVVVQTMPGPIFKQYGVKGIDEGQIVAMTETGNIKPGLSIIDQSNLLSRLQNALESGRGSVRVLVINDDDRELAVDMKVVHGPRLDDVPEGEVEDSIRHDVPDKEFVKAVRESQRANAEKALAEDANINALDDERRTVLFTALKNKDSEMIKFLLEHRIDLKVSDKYKDTVLDISVSDSGHYLTTFTLLKHGAHPTDNLDCGISELLLAAAAGDNKNIERLLGKGVKHSSCDRLGYTALHEAVCFGHYDTAKMLLLKGADVNKTITHGGATVLHAVIQRGREHRKFLTGHRRATPPLTGDHVRIVALLLRHNANTGLRRLHDKRNIRELVTEELKLTGNLRTTERGYLQKILVLLNRDVWQDAMHGRPTWPQVRGVDHIRIDRLKGSQLQVHVHTSGHDCRPSLVDAGSLEQDCTSDGGERSSLRAWAISEATSSQSEDYWRWVHLPANNKAWAEKAIHQLSGMDDETMKTYRSGINSFTTESYHEIRGPAQHARFRQPLFAPLPGSRGDIFSLVRTYRAFSTFPTKNLHAPLTLDQSYYLSLHNSQVRDEDQVVIKHVKRQESQEKLRPRTGTIRPKRLLMVNQMWVWKVDAVTLVTAFPDRRHPHQSDLSERITETIRTSPPLTIDSLISRLLRDVTGFVDAPTNAGLSENVFHIFEQSVAYRAQEDADCYARFNKLQKDLSTLEAERISRGISKNRDQKAMRIEAELCNITKEVHHLCEIKDIKDELKMIQKVLEDQKAVIDQYATSQEELNFGVKENRSDEEHEWLSGDGESQLLLETKRLLDLRIAKVKSLFTDASTVESSLNHLLDLKQKQGSLIVVRDTRSLANEADQRAKDSAWQSKLLFIFTIVTVVFTPISFISTFMAVPTREFPHLDGEEVSWRWWQVFAASIVVELLTFLVIAPWVEWNRFVRP
ncbi:hypothetical protein FSHL1_009833 [Fusarium sambucinum]